MPSAVQPFGKAMRTGSLATRRPKSRAVRRFPIRWIDERNSPDPKFLLPPWRDGTMNQWSPGEGEKVQALQEMMGVCSSQTRGSSNT